MREKLGRNYAALWTASAVSNLGDGIGTVAWPWLASLLTRDPLAIALVATAFRLPWLLFSLPAGVIVDRFDRRKIVVLMDAARFGVLIGLGFAIWSAQPLSTPADLGLPNAPLYWALLASALAVGFAEVLRDNAAQTLMPSIVPASRLEAANGRLWSVEVLMNSLIGPPLAGIILAIALPLSFFANGVGFALAAIFVLTIRGQFRAERGQEEKRHWLSEMREGASFLWRNNLLRNLALSLGILNAMDNLAIVALLLYAQEVLKLSSTEFGLLLTAGAVGGIVGGLVSEAVVKLTGPGLALRLTMALTFVELAVIAAFPHPAPVFAVLVVAHFMGMIWNTITVTLRQRLVPAHMLGRVNSVYRFFGWGMIPVGMALSGLIVKAAETVLSREASLTMPFVIGAIVMAFLTLFVWRRFSNAAIENARFE